MCDVCDATLFNHHWACGRCGFVVCVDCYRSRLNPGPGPARVWGDCEKDRDSFSWLLCTTRQQHELQRLMLVQIIAGGALEELAVALKAVMPLPAKSEKEEDIPKVNDKDFSITINAYFIVKWRDQRLIVAKRNRTAEAERRRWRERQRAEGRKKRRRKKKLMMQQQQEREQRRREQERRRRPTPTPFSSSTSSSTTERTMASR